jgi:hypothetical protein
MRMSERTAISGLVWIGVALAAVPKVALAQTDEIQVYDAEIEEFGKFKGRGGSD